MALSVLQLNHQIRVFCFARYSGAQTVAEAQSKVAREASPGLSDSHLAGQDDSEVLQHLRRLSKRDATTRLKALQARFFVPKSAFASLVHYCLFWFVFCSSPILKRAMPAVRTRVG